MNQKTDPTPRLRKLKSTGAMVVWHPCTHVMPDGSYCGKEAPYGYGVFRISRGQWKKVPGKPSLLEWKGLAPLGAMGCWRCKDHKQFMEIT